MRRQRKKGPVPVSKRKTVDWGIASSSHQDSILMPHKINKQTNKYENSPGAATTRQRGHSEMVSQEIQTCLIFLLTPVGR